MSLSQCTRLMISIHAPAGGATQAVCKQLLKKSNFNPRSRGGSDFGLPETNCSKRDFNPRSRGGSDAQKKILQHYHNNFNPRSRGGSDWGPLDSDGHPIKISIHAPAGGATANDAKGLQASVLFQSTLPRGERLESDALRAYGANFNPRSRGGSDEVNNALIQVKFISIHAPAGGATAKIDKVFFQNSNTYIYFA